MPEGTSIDAPPAALVGYLARNEKSLAWVWRVGAALAYFWLTGHFVSQETYAKDQAERAKDDKTLAVTLTQLNGTLSHYEDLVKRLDDHETRIRSLEKDSRSRP